MPIEIRELVIRATIVDQNPQDSDNEGETSSESSLGIDQNKIIQECVSQVMKIIQKSKNR